MQRASEGPQDSWGEDNALVMRKWVKAEWGRREKAQWRGPRQEWKWEKSEKTGGGMNVHMWKTQLQRF